MKALRELKNKAADLFQKRNFEASCAAYGELMQAMMEIESKEVIIKPSEEEEFNRFKAVIFANIALGNLKLGAFEAVRRTCNASIAFINEPSLPLMDLGLEDRTSDDVNGHPAVNEPVREEVKALSAKVLYRRACALHAMSGLNRERQILDDLNMAATLVPNDRTIEAFGQRIEKEREGWKSSNIPAPDLFAVQIKPEMVNGGLCFKRKGHWSQTVATAEVCLPLSNFLCTAQTRDDFLGSIEGEGEKEGSALVIVKAGVTKSSLSVSIDRETVTVRVPSLTHDVGEECHELALEYFVQPKESYWRLEALYSNKDVVNPTSDEKLNGLRGLGGKELPVSHLVLSFTKAPSVEWFPGCEWWGCVCIGDEEIDTSTCTVGTDTSELPHEAWLRAQSEHARFSDLGEDEQEEELRGLAQLRRDAFDAVRKHEKEEQEAFSQEPERKEMLGALRAEFPHIYFGAKTDKDESM